MSGVSDKPLARWFESLPGGAPGEKALQRLLADDVAPSVLRNAAWSHLATLIWESDLIQSKCLLDLRRSGVTGTLKYVVHLGPVRAALEEWFEVPGGALVPRAGLCSTLDEFTEGLREQLGDDFGLETGYRPWTEDGLRVHRIMTFVRNPSGVAHGPQQRRGVSSIRLAAGRYVHAWDGWWLVSPPMSLEHAQQVVEHQRRYRPYHAESVNEVPL